MMLIKTRVFGGDHSVLEIGRDSTQWNEFVTLVIRRVLNPGLQATLHVHSCSGWVDPSGSHEDQRRKRPKKRCSDQKPSNEGSEQSLPKRGSGRCAWAFG